jgi:hypothetical protein
MKFIALIFLFTATILYACENKLNKPQVKSTQHNKADIRTRIFSKYLSETFKLTIGEQQHVYVLIPGRGCNGCMENTLRRIKLLNPERKQTTIIASSNNRLPDASYPFPFLIDQKGMMENFNLHISNITIIRTEKFHIYDITNFDGIIDRGLDTTLLWKSMSKPKTSEGQSIQEMSK